MNRSRAYLWGVILSLTAILAGWSILAAAAEPTGYSWSATAPTPAWLPEATQPFLVPVAAPWQPWPTNWDLSSPSSGHSRVYVNINGAERRFESHHSSVCYQATYRNGQLTESHDCDDISAGRNLPDHDQLRADLEARRQAAEERMRDHMNAMNAARSWYWP